MFSCSRWEQSLFLLVVASIGSSRYPTAVGQESCDINSDQCPYQLDGACDVDLGYCLEGQDCFDCSDCAQYKLDCGACVANGCYYCASEGLCYSQPIGETYWNQIYSVSPKRTSCDKENAWTNTCATTSNPNNVFSDPFYSTNQWIYDLLNVETAWKQGYTGKGIMVRVNDPDGVDTRHPELSANFDVGASCDGYLPSYLSPEPQTEENPEGVPEGEETPDHGTAVASLCCGGANNGECAVGIAPGATLSACKGPVLLYDDLNPAFNFIHGLATTDVSVNSWGFDACSVHADKDVSLGVSRRKFGGGGDGGGRKGRKLQNVPSCPFVKQDPSNPCANEKCQDWGSEECETYIAQYCQANGEEEHVACAEFLDTFMDCHFNVLTEEGQTALALGVTEGRGGKGISYLIAAGNEYEKWEDVNYEGWLNTRMTTVVAAVGKDGKHASYSTPGAAVFISGPGGDMKESMTNNIVANLGGSGCVDATVGTSFATPSVSGAVALVLEANPSLGWRDVQGIMAATAQKTDSDNPSWTTNGAGLHHSNLYGFGIMDASRAVEAAKKWIQYGPEKQYTVESGNINLPIADDATQATTSTMSAATSTMSVNVDTIVETEAVAVYLQLDYASRGDLEVTLTSPQGTESILSPGKRPENVHLEGSERWKLLTVRTYGENPNGDWTLSLRDLRRGDPRDCVDYPFLSTQEDPETPGGFVQFRCAIMSSFCNPDGTSTVDFFDQVLDDQTGKNPFEACCVCGGGGKPASTVNTLVSWKMIVYGHETKIFVSTPPDITSDATTSYHHRQSSVVVSALTTTTILSMLALVLSIANIP